MRQLAILTFVTLDGIMQAPSMPDEDVSGGFNRGGWAADFWQDVMVQVQKEAMAEPYDMLFGRKTYEMFAGHWPAADDGNLAAKIMNEAKKYVVTSTLSELVWANSQQITGDVVAEVAQLKKQEGPLLQIHGSWQLIQAMLSNDLVDEFRLWTFPVVVGSGKRLFDRGTIPTKATLIKSEACSNGAMMTIYRRA